MTEKNVVVGSIAVCAAVWGLSVFGEDPYVYEFAPEVVCATNGEASASKFVWAADGEPTNGGVSYYRHTFSLSAKPAWAMLSRCLDDKGEVYVNGHALEGRRTVTSYLVAGENTIAVSLTNTTSVSAALYLLECDYGSGVTSYVHSCAAVKGTVNTPATGWDQPGFNDSSWPQVRVVGDALAEPFATRFAGRIDLCLTPEDKARIAAIQGAAQAFEDAWAGLEDEPDPVARIVYRGSSPFVELNGKLHDPIFNICQVGDPYNESAIVRLSRAGFDIVQLNFFADDFYKGEGNPFDFSKVGEKVRRLMELNPDAYVVISPRFMMQSWAVAHPSEQVGYANGTADPTADDELRERVVRPSPASDQFRSLAREMILAFGSYVNAQPWRKRLVGFRLSYGTYSEWSLFAMREGPDNGPRMQEKFRAYMKAKRNVDDAEIPSLAARRHEYSDPSQNSDLLDPVEDRLVLDYYDCLANTVADLLLAMADAARQAFPGRLIGAYYGYLYDDHRPEGATSLIDKVLSSPNVDILSCPAYYSIEGRRAGGSYVTRTIPSLFRRYGKLSLLEDDSRFHHIRSWLQSNNDGFAMATETPRETEMDMRRNWLNQFFDGGGIQINDPITQSGHRPHAFDDPAVFEAIADSKVALAKAGNAAAESGNKVAVIFSPRETLRRDGGEGSFFTWNLYQTSLLYLNRTGIAFDLLSLEDYIANPRDYDVVMFLNVFYLTPDERTALVQRTRRSGITAIWIGPAGGVTDNGFDDVTMSTLMGMTASGAARRPRIVCSGSEDFYTDNVIYYVKTLEGGARSIVVNKMPESVEDYVTILHEAGARSYAAPGSYFRRHGDVFMFHTGTAGTHTITLPDGVVKVKELYTGEEFNSNVITLETDGPSTWLFKATSGGIWSVGESAIAVLDTNGVLSIDGTGSTYDFANAADVPWDTNKVRSVIVGDAVTLGTNALAALPDTATLGGVPLKMLRSGLGAPESTVPAGMLLVSRTEVESAGAETLEVANGTAILGISVCTNSDLTVPTAAWAPVLFRKSDLEVSADGTRILAPIPANAEKGFMILRSGAPVNQ